MDPQRRRSLQILLATALAGSIFYFSELGDSSSFLRSNNYHQQGSGRQLLNSHDTQRSDQLAADDETARRENCQFIYILGVEGVGHHGFTPVLKRLIEHQIDVATGRLYKYEDPEDYVVQKAIFGRKANGTPIDDPEMIQQLLQKVCPNDGRKHVLPLGTSFPSKSFNDGYYPVSRQKEWANMSMQDIAGSETALKHPLNLRAFHRAYTPYVDIKYVALSNTFVETVASHVGFDGGPEQHMNVLSGYLMLIRRFLDWTTDAEGAGKKRVKPWTLVCMEQLSAKFYNGDVASVMAARNALVYKLSHFLGWEKDRCDDCFDHWRESDRIAAERKLKGRGAQEGKPHIMELMNMKLEALNGVWPPPPPLKGQPQCMA